MNFILSCQISVVKKKKTSKVSTVYVELQVVVRKLFAHLEIFKGVLPLIRLGQTSLKARHVLNFMLSCQISVIKK